MTRTAWALLLTVAVAAALMAPGLWVGPSLDASIFSTVGWRIAEGDALYAEIWDHKPPGVYLPYIAAELLTADAAASWNVVWLISVGSVCFMALAVRDVLRRHGVDAILASAAAGLGALGASAYLLSLGGGLGETFALAPMSGALMAAGRQRWVLAGALVELSVVISLQAAPVGVAVGLLAVTGTDRTVTRRLMLALLGGFGLLLATLAAVALNGGLAAAADALIAYSAAYRAVSTEGASRSVWSLVPWAILALLPLILGVGLAAVGRRRLAGGHLAAACAAWLVIAVAMIAFQGRFYAHYAAPLVVPMAVLAGLGLAASASRARVVLIAALTGACAVSLVVGAAGAGYEQRSIAASSSRVEAVANELSADQNGRLLVWGNDARLYQAARLRPAVRYPYLYPLLTPGYVTGPLIAELLDRLEEDPPRFVVDSGSLEPGAPGLPPLLMDRPVATDGRDADLLDPLRAFIDERYELRSVVGGWPVYELRQTGSTARRGP